MDRTLSDHYTGHLYLTIKKMSADTSKCTGYLCPIKDKCWRFTIKDAPDRQLYFTNPPYNHTTKICSEQVEFAFIYDKSLE